MELSFNHKKSANLSGNQETHKCTNSSVKWYIKMAALTVTTLCLNVIDSFLKRTLPSWLEARYYIVLLTNFTPGWYTVGDYQLTIEN